MSTLSEGSRRIVASLAQRIGPNADTARIAGTLVTVLQAIEAALTPVIGQQGVVALYRRSFHLITVAHPRLAGIYDTALATDLIALKSILVEQSETDALFFGETLLTTLYELLTTLIGPSLTARLLQSVSAPSQSDTPLQENSP